MRNVARSLFAATAALVLTLTACARSDGGGEGGDDPRDERSDAPAAPFVIDRVPDGFQLAAVGEGTAQQDWSSDIEGTDEAFVVLGDGDRRVIVSAFGYEGTQGGLGQVGESPEPMTDRGWTTVSRDLGDDLAIRASSRDVEGDELDSLLDHVTVPDDRRRAPTVQDLPDGWQVIGHSDADVVMSAHAYLQEPSNDVPGPTGAYGAGWVAPDRSTNASQFTAVSLDGDAATVEAWTGQLLRPVNWYGDAHGEPVTVDGRDAAFVLLTGSEGGTIHLLLSEMEDGSLLLLSSSGDETLTRDQLVDVAASARPATDAEWTDMSNSTWGGPTLQPDEGEVELARGVEDGEEWLLQATRTPRTDQYLVPTLSNSDPTAEWHIDPCLKLIGGRRACSEGTPFVARYQRTMSTETSGVFPTEFLLIRTTTPGATLRIAGRSDTVTAPLHELPDASARVAVVMEAYPVGFDGCSRSSAPPTFPEDADFEVVYFDVLDANGNFAGCANEPLPPG